MKNDVVVEEQADASKAVVTGPFGGGFQYLLACDFPPVDHRRTYGQYRPDQFGD
jgi:hypothetical protein